MTPTSPTSVEGKPCTPVDATRGSKTAPPTLEFRRLSGDCPRSTFGCGHTEIDRWFRQNSLKYHNKHRARVVTAHLVGNKNPVGFYALTTKLEADDLLPADHRLFSRAEQGYFTSVQLFYLAVQRSMQRQGLGTIIMGDVLRSFYEVANRTGILALTLVAIDEPTTEFYRKLGFVPYGPNGGRPRMLLPAQIVIELVEKAR